MASKTYVSEQPSLFMGKGVDFSHGKFTTDDAGVQKFIEGNERFGKSIKLMPSLLDSARAHAVSLRALAVKANKAAADAEAAVEALEPKQVPVE
jgi:hypothetical protein